MPQPPAPHTLAWIGLGANLGDASATLGRALRALAATPGIRSVTASPILRTEPIGPRQPRYSNAVARLETTLAPEPLLAALLTIERAFHRVRSLRWGPRTLDLDLLLHGPRGATVHASASLTLPHPQLHLRPFVLVPLLALDPGLVHPVTGRPLAAHLEALTSAASLL
jgi:2-amino-4-hydroxy-6-hydroxymethyldihydropteridine diphosphokinase